MSKSKVSIEEKVQKEFPDFCVDCQGLGVEGLNQKLLTYAKHQEEIEDSLENNEHLKAAREALNELSAPYRDAKKAVRLKMRYIINMIKEKGGV
jgi:hypothetical protein